MTAGTASTSTASPAVADRVELIGQLCRDAGRDRAEFRLAVALTQPRPEDVSALAELGIDELVIVAAPPDDVDEVPGWAADLAQRWLVGS